MPGTTLCIVDGISIKLGNAKALRVEKNNGGCLRGLTELIKGAGYIWEKHENRPHVYENRPHVYK